MARPRQGYKMQDGRRVPGVTTILSHMDGDPGGLMHWAWNLGMEGKDYRLERDKAAGIGTIAHELIDANMLGKPEPELTAEHFGVDEENWPAMMSKARKAFGAYREWRSSIALEVVATELPLVSEWWQFGGTFDMLARLNGKLVIVDWKSSKSLYPKAIAQCAAYTLLVYEKLGMWCSGGAHLLRVGKEHGDFHHHYWDDDILDVARNAFYACQVVYDANKILKEVL